MKVLLSFTGKEMSAVENEINLMQKIDHSHVVKYYGNFFYSNDIRCILMEICEVNIFKYMMINFGSLVQIGIRDNSLKLCEKERKKERKKNIFFLFVVK